MTPPPPVIDVNGRPFPLDRQLGAGGEGVVFALPNNVAHVAKVYHQPPTTQIVEKLTTLVNLANPQLLALAAWPMSLLYHARTRHLAGFVMPRLSDCQPIQHLYNPVQRLRFFPRAAWNFQVRAAVNLAAAFDEVHKAGCLVGDVNQSNVQVSSQALVRLIDCDSFQVRVNGKAFLCEVGVAHYIPPELQGRTLRGLVRTENHDRFGLAVLIYQLLFVGRHPYSGVYRGTGDPSFEQLIAEFRFAQGPAAQSWSMAPPPHTPTFADIPPALGNLFRRAFERGSESGTRPRPAEWLATLRSLEQEIVECSVDPGHKYWRGARSCVWCRLADHGGPEYYFGAAGGAGTFAVDEAALQDVMRRLNACGPIEDPYDRRKVMPRQLPPPEPLPEGAETHQSTSLILGIAVGLCLLAVLIGVILQGIFIAGFFCALVFGTWLAVHLSRSPWHREYRRRRAARNQARHQLEKIEENWRETVSRYRRDLSEKSRSLQKMVSDCRELGPQFQTELLRLMANAEAIARVRHLRLYLIADADIPKIGAGRKQVLASHGIFTAADIEDYRIGSIKGFGEVLTSSLLVWKEGVLRQFRFHPTKDVSPAEQRSITVLFRNRQQQILVDIRRRIADVESLAPTCRDSLQRLIPELKRAALQYQKAESDLGIMRKKS